MEKTALENIVPIFVFVLIFSPIFFLMFRDWYNDTYRCKKLARQVLREIKRPNCFVEIHSDKNQNLYWYTIEIPKKDSGIRIPPVRFLVQYDADMECYYLKYVFLKVYGTSKSRSDIVCFDKPAKKIWKALMRNYPRTDCVATKTPKLDTTEDCVKWLNSTLSVIGRERKKLEKDRKWKAY